MSLTITPASKNALTVTNDTPSGSDRTWDEAVETWDEATYTWDEPKTIFTKDAKAALSINNASKS